MGLRRVLVVLGVVALLVVSSPDAQAATATIVRAVTNCSVDGVVAGKSGACPIDSRKITGRATGTARFDLAARAFNVGASADPNPRIPLGRGSSTILELRSNVVTSKGGPVKVVLSNLSGRSTRQCPAVCAALGRTYANTGLWVQLVGKDLPNTPQALCSLTWTGGTATVPQTMVVPDDCSPEATLEAPPNSTFEVVMLVLAQAQAAGGAAKARSTLTGVVSEIRVP